jgi:hypothetical protein
VHGTAAIRTHIDSMGAQAESGDARSDALAPAALTIADGKIQRFTVGSCAGAATSDVAADSQLPALDLDGGMIWPVCVAPLCRSASLRRPMARS